MQTFLPYPGFWESAVCLDRLRLGKQRSETKTMLVTLTTDRRGWANHPATKMWSGYEQALAEYGIAVCSSWRDRGYNDSLLPFFKNMFSRLKRARRRPIKYPPWLGDERFHLSHKSNLIRKDPEHYGPMWPGVPDDLPYIWPA